MNSILASISWNTLQYWVILVATARKTLVFFRDSSKHKVNKDVLCLECAKLLQHEVCRLALQRPAPPKGSCNQKKKKSAPLDSQSKQSQNRTGKIVWHHDLGKDQPLAARLLTPSYPLCFLSKSSNCCSFAFWCQHFFFSKSNRWGMVGEWQGLQSRK